LTKEEIAGEDVIARFRRKEVRQTVEVLLKNKWIIEEANDIRELYYMARSLTAKKGYHEAYEWLRTIEAYNYFTQDILNRLEAWGVIKSKPPAKPVGFYIREGVMHFIADLIRERIDKFKGIIYVEKESVAKSLSPLSELGYIIMAGQGFPTRLMRELAKKGKLFVLHDADKSGNDIYRVFSEGAKRLRRISEEYAMQWVVRHAKDLGLSYSDAERLNLDPEPEVPKYRDRYKRRYELQALVKLKYSHNIKNPYVAYVAYKLEKLGEDLRPKLLDPEEMYARKAYIVASLAIGRKLAEIASNISATTLKSVQDAGQPILDGFRLRRDLLEKIAMKSIKRLSEEILSKPIEISISDYDCTVVIGGISGFESPEDFVKKFKEKYGVFKIYELLE